MKSMSTLRHFTREDLSQHNGKDKPTIYIGYKGRVYDVTDSYFWRGGNHFVRHKAGIDLTIYLAAAPHGDDLLNKYPAIGILEDTGEWELIAQKSEVIGGSKYYPTRLENDETMK
jgi:predicted heme/steroid binding protein